MTSELFAALIGVGLTLALGAVGWVLNAANESRKWRRQERLRTYTDLGRDHRRAYQKFSEVVVIKDFNTGRYRDLLFECVDILEKTEVNWSGVEIIGSKAHSARMAAYIKFLNKIIGDLTPDGHQIEHEWFISEHTKLWGAVVKQAKRDLSIKF